MDLRHFVGREREMRRLLDALHDAASGNVRLCLLAGPAGIGKSRLAEELGSRAEAEDALVLYGPSHEGESHPPYAPWRLALAQYARATKGACSGPPAGSAFETLAHVVPELSQKTPRTESDAGLAAVDGQFQLYTALATVLEALSAQRVLVLIFDDLQWADASSLRLLEQVAEARLRARVVIVGTYRDDELPRSAALAHVLAAVSGTAACDHILLEPLGKPEQLEYLRGVVGDGAGRENDAWYKRTEGNPLFMVELARSWTISRRESIAELPVPGGVRAVIVPRLTGLGRESRDALAHAAVIGREIDLGLLAEVLSQRADSLAASIDEWIGAGIIEEQPHPPGRFRFRHGMVQQAVLDTVGPMQRMRIHGRVAEILKAHVEAGARHRLSSLVHHLLQAAPVIDGEKLASYAHQAAEQALARYAPESALGVLNSAVEALSDWAAACGSRSRSLAALLHCRARTNTELESLQDVEDDLERAFDIYEELGDVESLVRVALTPIGNTAGLPPVIVRFRSQPLIERALKLVEPGTLDYARLLFFCISRLRSPEVADPEILEIARRYGDPALKAMALAREVVVALARYAPGAVAKAEGAIRLANAEREFESAAFMTYWLSYNFVVSGHSSEALCLAGELADRAHRSRSLGWRIVSHYTYAQIHSFTGWWAAACHHAEKVLALSPRRTDSFAVLAARHSLAIARMETGAITRDAELVDLLTVGDRREVWTTPLLEILFCSIHDHRVLLQDAAARLRSYAAGIPDLAAPSYSTTGLLMGLSTAAFLSEDRTEATALLPVFEELRQRSVCRFVKGRPLEGQQALLFTVLGCYDEAFVCFDAATAASEEAGYMPSLAWNCCRHAEARVRRGAPGDVEAARGLLQRASAVARDLAMVPLTQRINAHLAGLPGGRAGANGSPDGLTDREVEVLRLVARGYTNKEIGERLFISRHTAATHVQHILEKTGMANRAEATAYAARKSLL